MASIDRLQAANLSFEALNSQVAADHSTSLLENLSMPATLPPPPSTEQSHLIQTGYKPDSPHNYTSPLYTLQPSSDGTCVSTYPQHGLQTRRGRPVKPPERFRDFV